MRYIPLFQRELLAANLELMIPQWPWLMARPRLPVLVAGGDIDRFVPRSDLELTSMFWGGERRTLEGVPHALMLDATWRLAADVVADWLEKTFGPGPGRGTDAIREHPSRRPPGSRRELSRPASGSARPRES